MLLSVTHCVDEEIDTQAECFDRGFQWIYALIDVIPKILEVVVVAGDNREIPAFVLQSIKDRLAIDEVRRGDVQRINSEKIMEDRVLDRQPFEIPVRESLVKIPLQCVQIAS